MMNCSRQDILNRADHVVDSGEMLSAQSHRIASCLQLCFAVFTRLLSWFVSIALPVY